MLYQNSSIIDKIVTKLLVYYLLYFKFANILKQKMHLLCLLLLEKMPYRNINPFMIFSMEEGVYKDRPKLLDQLCEAMRLKYYSLKTKKSHVHWGANNHIAGFKKKTLILPIEELPYFANCFNDS